MERDNNLIHVLFALFDNPTAQEATTKHLARITNGADEGIDGLCLAIKESNSSAIKLFLIRGLCQALLSTSLKMVLDEVAKTGRVEDLNAKAFQYSVYMMYGLCQSGLAPLPPNKI